MPVAHRADGFVRFLGTERGHHLVGLADGGRALQDVGGSVRDQVEHIIRVARRVLQRHGADRVGIAARDVRLPQEAFQDGRALIWRYC